MLHVVKNCISFYQGMLKKVSRKLFKEITGTSKLGTNENKETLTAAAQCFYDNCDSGHNKYREIHHLSTYIVSV